VTHRRRAKRKRLTNFKRTWPRGNKVPRQIRGCHPTDYNSPERSGLALFVQQNGPPLGRWGPCPCGSVSCTHSRRRACIVGVRVPVLLRPGLVVGLPASQPAHIRDDHAPVPAVKRVRLHDLRHTFGTLQLSSGVHFMQVSEWLGPQQLRAHAEDLRRLHPRGRYGCTEVCAAGCKRYRQCGGPTAEKATAGTGVTRL
jgi:integrase